MASFTLEPGPFPAGTTVGVYLRRALIRSNGPVGVRPVTTAVTGTDLLTAFTGLAHGTRYQAAAQVGGSWAVVAFTTDPADMSAVDALQVEVDGKIPYALFDAKGDLLVASGPDAAARVAAGPDGQRLTTDAAQPAGVKWAPKTTIPLTYDLYGAEPEDWKALQGPAAVTAYGWPGAALTANTTIFHEGLDVASITYVNWRVVWTPKAVACGIRLVLFETLATLTQVAELTNNASTTSVNSSVDITAAFKTNYAASTSLLTAGHQLKGNGTVGPLIFVSRLECLFRV